MVRVIVRMPHDRTVKQHYLRGVSQGSVAEHFWCSHNGQTLFVPVNREIELDSRFVPVIQDAGGSVEVV